jgi:hypothetical protein
MIDNTAVCTGATDRFSSLRDAILAFMNSLPASVAPTRGDLILGFATGYKPHMITPFVESVRTHGQFAGKIVLFVDPGARNMVDYLMDHGIEAIAFDPSESPVAHVILARFFSYFGYLREQWNSGVVFNQILLTDVRDVIFQKPLFGTPCDELEFHLEELTIGNDWFNRRALDMTCGKETADELSSKTVSCVGTVSGRAIGILEYLAQIQLFALGLSEPSRSRWGVDTGLHNYILHAGLARAAISKPNFSRVATLGAVRASKLACDAKGRVVNRDGEMSEIVHQWDRHWHLSKGICAAYKQNKWYIRWRFWIATAQALRQLMFPPRG